MPGYFDRVKRRTDEAIEMQSGASRAEAEMMADENYRAEEERRRRKKGRPLMSSQEKEDWGNTLRRLVGMRREEP